MKKQQLTVRDIAELIRRPHEEIGTVVDRTRGWADFDLIKVSGDKHPGTGKKRLYEPGAVIDAIVLTALTDAGLAAVRVGHFASADGRTVLGMGRASAYGILGDEEDPAFRGQGFLEISGPPNPSRAFRVAISPGETSLTQLMGRSRAPWSIILNLTEYLRPLKGIVKATRPGGFIKFELSTD
jgi:hypothetical protein